MIQRHCGKREHSRKNQFVDPAFGKRKIVNGWGKIESGRTFQFGSPGRKTEIKKCDMEREKSIKGDYLPVCQKSEKRLPERNY